MIRDLADFVDDVDEAKLQMEQVLLEYRAGIYTVGLPSRRVWDLDGLILVLADEVLALRQAQAEWLMDKFECTGPSKFDCTEVTEVFNGNK